MPDDKKDSIIDIRDAVFKASDGKSLDEALQGIIMAQGKLIASAVRDPEEAQYVLDQYYGMLREALPIYCKELHN